MKVINLFAGPGAGKSTTAAGVFYRMKTMGLNVELITEYAKDMTWEARYNVLADQLYVFAKQHRRQLRVKDQVDYIVTDSPLLLCLHYAPDDYPASFERLVLDMWGEFDNHNFFLLREKPYVQIGRSQTEEEARQIDLALYDLLWEHHQRYSHIPGNEKAADLIIEKVV